MSSGALDAQDIVIWGKVRSDMTWNELARIRELCKWGEQFGLDGFVRYWFHRFPRLDVSLTGALPSGWKWTCGYHFFCRSLKSVDLRPCVAKS